MDTIMNTTLESIENALKLQIQANAERRSAKAEQEEKEFKEKLTRAYTSRIELEGKASGIKGAQEAVRRDQLMALMLAGF